jgi:predicted PurR-regulated permease PerM
MKAPFKPRDEDLPYLRKVGWTILIAAALLIVWRASELMLLAFGSVLGAVMFRSAGRLIQGWGLRNWNLALALGIVLVLSIFGGMIYLLTVQFGSELGAMLGNLPGTIDKVEAGLSESAVGAAIVQAVDAAAGGDTIANRLGALMSGAGEVVLNLVIVIVGALFIAGDPGPYRRAIVMLTPRPARTTMDRALGEISLALRLWLKAKLISMTLMSVLIGGSLWLAGLDSWAALGLLGGLSEFVPYVGPALAMLPSIGLAAGEGGDVLWRTAVAYVATRIFEAWLITPIVNRQVVAIPPALTLFTILAVGAVFGLFGVFFSGALLIVAFVGVREFYLRDTLGEDLDGVPRDDAKLPLETARDPVLP